MDKKGIIWLILLGSALVILLRSPDTKVQVNPTPATPETISSSTISTPEANTGTEVKPSGNVITEVPDLQLAKAEAPVVHHPSIKLSQSADFDLQIKPGFGLESAAFNKHFETLEKKNTVYIGDSARPSFGFSGSAEKWQRGATTIISSSESSLETETSYNQNSFKITTTWTLDKKYQFKVQHSITNTSDKAIDFKQLYLNCGDVRPIQMGDHSFFAQQAIGNDQAVDACLSESRKIDTNLITSIKSDIEDQKEEAEEQGREFIDNGFLISDDEETYDWIAVKNQYFAFIVDLDSDFQKARLNTIPLELDELDENGKKKTYDLIQAEGRLADFDLAPGAKRDFNIDAFAGPQKLTILKELGKDKKGIMQLNMFMNMKVAWLGKLSEIILNILFFFNNYVHSMGLAIILLTISVKLAFWRLTNKSNKSMKKMAILGPRIKEIREQYKAEPQVMNQKVMALYKEEGVNPAGGCLPMLLQMPIFIALFNALRGAIELRHVDFLWAMDLSLPDTLDIAGVPVRPLVLTWALLMLVQQKMTPSSADETQKKVMMFMPVMMLFFCYGMPSGLTLYWCFQSLMTLLQHWMNNRNSDFASPGAAEIVTK
jgi:YidC/Oxa1 family membrane protein insertase